MILQIISIFSHLPHPMNPAATDIIIASIPVIIWPAVVIVAADPLRGDISITSSREKVS